MGVAGLSNSIAHDMRRFGVRSNCISPFAWSRLIATIPTETAEQREKVERVKSMTPEKIAPLATRSEEHTSELPSIMRISYAVFCLKKKKSYLSTQNRSK